ncbi:MAG: class I SAM-dependent methyltransferase [Desulfobacteraceae bacterium]|nr:class I SAM-dependent methyltransferase [Desulfobacteraceae bacterium]
MKDGYEEFFNCYDEFRYKQHSHLLKCLDAIDFKNKRVLEIGLGLGADSEQIIRRGAIWSGIDLTPASIDRVAKRLSLWNLPYERLELGTLCDLPFGQSTFDIVFAHGVLHHVPETSKSRADISRVLKLNGQLIAMLYAKYSLNYLVSICVLRRLALMLLYQSGLKPKGIIGQHLENAHQMGLFRYLRMENFIRRNTDGPLNPYSKVYDVKKLKKDFPDFRIVKVYKRFMWAPPLPVSRLPFAPLLGWHLWVHMAPVNKG